MASLEELTAEFDSLDKQIKKLDAQKTKVRAQMIKLFNERIAEEFPELDDPENQSYHYFNPENGLIYKKSIAEVGTKFDAAGFWNRNKRNSLGFLVNQVTTYELDEVRAEEWLAEHPEDEEELQKFIVPGKKQTRIYTGTKPTELDL